MTESDVKEIASLEGLLPSLAQSHANDLAKRYLERALRLWNRIDRFSTWLLGAAGASIALVMSQLSTIRGQLGVTMTRAFLWCMAISVLAGLAQKYMAFSVGLTAEFGKISSELADEFKAQYAESLKAMQGATIDTLAKKYLVPLMRAYIEVVKPAIPKPLQFLLHGAVSNSLAITNPNRAAQNGFRWLLWLILLVMAQLLTVAIAIIIAACAV
jgi:hypothetical protein